MENPKYSFVFLPNKKPKVFSTYSERLIQWSMQGPLKVRYFNFDRPFQFQYKNVFAEQFFKDKGVISSLCSQKESLPWDRIGNSSKHTIFSLICPVDSVSVKATEKMEIENVPCSVLSMKFFHRVLDPLNGIVRGPKQHIIQCPEENINGFFVTDNLQKMIIDKHSAQYKLYSDFEREELIFRIFGHFILGGVLCQPVDYAQPYLDITKDLYKDLMSAERVKKENQIVIRSLALKISFYNAKKESILLDELDFYQTFAYMIIDPFKRQVALFDHSYSGQLNL